MKYALGALASRRYARYLLTVIFDMFFTVILFRFLFSKLIRLAGYSHRGREWIANGMVSCFVSVVTYQVYANMCAARERPVSPPAPPAPHAPHAHTRRTVLTPLVDTPGRASSGLILRASRTLMASLRSSGSPARRWSSPRSS